MARLSASNLLTEVPSDSSSLEEGGSSSSDTPGPQGEKDRGEKLLECSIEQTVWDCPAIIGLPAIGRGNSIALGMSLLLNTVLQAYICYILISSPRFTSPHPLRDLANYAHLWRIQVAHESSQLDASGSSLASRVCGGDLSLSVAATHFNTLADINAYLSLNADGIHPFAFGHFGIGPMLCSVCITVFVVMVLRELRTVAMQVLALSSIERGRRTKVVDFAFVTLSNTRLACVLFVSAVRAAVALVLLYAGTIWLAATTSIQDLILNCAALGFVLEVDERIHETVVPTWVHSFVTKLKPIPFRRPRRNLDAVVPMVSMVALVTLSITLLLIPNVNDMLDVKRAMCGGNRDFVIKQNIAGFVVARATVPYGTADITGFDSRARLRMMAVNELLDRPMGPPNSTSIAQYSLRKFSREQFEKDADLPIRDWADWALCEDMDTAYDGRWLKDMPAYFYTIRETTGLHRGHSLKEVPWNCSDYAQAGFCKNNSMLRLFCPISCGCTRPKSGLLFGQTSQGCPAQCEPLLQEASAVMPCEDTEPGEEAWTEYWQEYDTFARRMVPQMRAAYDNYTALKISIGCDDNTPDPIPGTLLCDERHPYMVRRGMRSIASFCPKKCCGGPDPDPSCPASCPRTGGPPSARKRW